MKRDVPMLLNRNEKRHLGGYEASKRAAKQTVERAVRRGQLSEGVAKKQAATRCQSYKAGVGLDGYRGAFQGDQVRHC
jgi:hypothetical protein